MVRPWTPETTTQVEIYMTDHENQPSSKGKFYMAKSQWTVIFNQKPQNNFEGKIPESVKDVML